MGNMWRSRWTATLACACALTHCSELLVQPGDTVRAGQPVARVGSTGNSTGNHCHLELLADEYYTDPELILMRPEP